MFFLFCFCARCAAQGGVLCFAVSYERLCSARRLSVSIPPAASYIYRVDYTMYFTCLQRDSPVRPVSRQTARCVRPPRAPNSTQTRLLCTKDNSRTPGGAEATCARRAELAQPCADSFTRVSPPPSPPFPFPPSRTPSSALAHSPPSCARRDRASDKRPSLSLPPKPSPPRAPEPAVAPVMTPYPRSNRSGDTLIELAEPRARTRTRTRLNADRD